MSPGSAVAGFSVSRPRLVVAAVAAATVVVAVLAGLPSVWPGGFASLHPLEVDTDPENMLAPDEPMRVFHDRMKRRLTLHDMIVVGVVNEAHPQGVFNPVSLTKVHELTAYARTLRWPAEDGGGEVGVVEADIIAPSVVDSIQPIPGKRMIRLTWLMDSPPASDAEAREILADAQRMPFFRGTMVPAAEGDDRAVCLYLPITSKDLSYRVYEALNDRLPVLWAWGPLRRELDRLEAASKEQVDALRRLGRLAAFAADGRERFEALIAGLAEQAAGNRLAADWRAVEKALGEWRSRAETLDAEADEAIAALRAREAGASAVARRRAEAAREAREELAGFLADRGSADGAGAPAMLAFAELHVRASRRRDQTAGGLLAETRRFARRMAGALDDPGGALRRLPATAGQVFAAHADFPGRDRCYVTGLPVAEDTFGVEMFIQMAISAPAAMAVIFLLMLAFFRKLALIVSPLLVALVSVVLTMGALIIAGFPVHIMSSMIPIFIMPIAVLDSVHIISEFFERYQETRDRAATMKGVMGALFMPMLYTSLTSAAGFASLALTPIPPVQVFGVFVAMGVMAAWLLTITFVPAFVMFIPAHRLEGFGAVHRDGRAARGSLLGRFLRWVGGATYRRAKPVVAVAAAVMVLAGYGISRININDNPIKWFTADHPIRVADRVLNNHLGGTYMAYLAVEHAPGAFDASAAAEEIARRARHRAEGLKDFADRIPSAAKAVEGEIAGITEFHDKLAAKLAVDVDTAGDEELAVWLTGKEFLDRSWDPFADPPANFDPSRYADDLHRRARDYARQAEAALDLLVARARIVATPRSATRQGRTPAAPAAGPPGTRERFFDALRANFGSARTTATRPAGEFVALAWQTAETFLSERRQASQVFKAPDVLAHLRELQQVLGATGVVGKSNSLVQIVETVNRDMHDGKEAYRKIPPNRMAVADCLTQFQSGHRPRDLAHFVTTDDYCTTAVWVQLTSGDNKDMSAVAAALDEHLAARARPELTYNWFGLTYINVVWQEKMVVGMLQAFAGSFLVVFLLMMILFRSALWGLLCMVPLTVTIAAIYGGVGLVGKDYDMPVAVLSSLTLGLAVDFAIHFLARGRQMQPAHGSWRETIPAVFGEPARAIARNIVIIAAGFLPLLLAPLVPYKTVGVLMATILLVSGVATLLLLPALMRLLQRRLFAPRPAMGPACNCVLCLASSAAAVALLALTLHQFHFRNWHALTWVGLGGVVLLACICGILSRRQKCKAYAEGEEKDHDHDDAEGSKD